MRELSKEATYPLVSCASQKDVNSLIPAAGVPVDVVKLVDDLLVVATCEICRAWAKPGSKSIVLYACQKDSIRRLKLTCCSLEPMSSFI